MASPVDSARPTTSVSTAATSHAINVGSPSAGSLLVVFFRITSAPGTIAFTGYTQLGTDSTDAADDRVEVWYRWADGSEGPSDTMTTTNSVKLAAICWVITGAENPATRTPEISTVAIGTTAANSANPASRAVTGGPKDVLYLAMAGGDGELAAYTAAPTNYTNLVAADSGSLLAAATNCFMGGASRQIAASSSDDPGVFTHGAHTTGWSAWTVVVHPGAGGTTYTKASWAVVDADGFGASAFTSGAASGSSFQTRRQRRASRYLTFR